MKSQDVERVVGTNVVKLWGASDQVGLQLQLVLGGLLFTQLAERHSFDCTGNATQVRPLTAGLLCCPCCCCAEMPVDPSTIGHQVTTYISASTFEVLILLLGEQPGIPGDLFNCHLAGNGYLQVSMVKGPTCTSLCQNLCLAV